MITENIEKNMHLRRDQGKTTILWCLRNTIIYDFLLKSNYYDARRYWKNMYVRRGQGKITLLWCPTNTDNLWFFVKIIIWCPIILKKHLVKEWPRPRQNDISMTAKKMQTFHDFLLNSHDSNTQKYQKKHVLKAWLRKNHNTIYAFLLK